MRTKAKIEWWSTKQDKTRGCAPQRSITVALSRFCDEVRKLGEGFYVATESGTTVEFEVNAEGRVQ